jgi:hypothetical protein
MGSNTVILWLHIQAILAAQFPAITVSNICVKMQLIMLQYYVMFHYKECITLAGNLSYTICSQVNVRLILKEIKQWGNCPLNFLQHDV